MQQERVFPLALASFACELDLPLAGLAVGPRGAT
jgi:hypothetical protein